MRKKNPLTNWFAVIEEASKWFLASVPVHFNNFIIGGMKRSHILIKYYSTKYVGLVQ
jgi:hypothetical protein